MAAHARASHNSDRFHEQIGKVRSIIEAEGVFSPDKIRAEVEWFYNRLGLHEVYFTAHTPEMIAKHIQGLMAEKVRSRSSGSSFSIQLEMESDGSATFAARSRVRTKEEGASLLQQRSPCLNIEALIEAKYLDGRGEQSPDASGADLPGMPVRRIHLPTSKFGHDAAEASARERERARAGSSAPPELPAAQHYCLQCYRTAGVVGPAADMQFHLRFYFLRAPVFAEPNPAPGELDLDKIADRQFLERAGAKIKTLYRQLLERALDTQGPVIHTETWPDDEARLVIVHRLGSTHSYFSGVADLYRFYGMFSTRKYVEVLSNNFFIFTFLLRPVAGEFEGVPFRRRVRELAAAASMHFVLPRTSMTPLLREHLLTAKEVAYAYAAWKFCFHFISRGHREYTAVNAAILAAEGGKPGGARGLQADLMKLQQQMLSLTFTEGMILDIVVAQYEIVRKLYAHFAALHKPVPPASAAAGDGAGAGAGGDGEAALSARFAGAGSAAGVGPDADEELRTFIRKQAASEHAAKVFLTFLRFNRSVLKTNFFKPTKVALSFRLDPSFMDSAQYPERPFAVIYAVGAEFRGFHVRFRDIARGGIRIVRSAYPQAYSHNVEQLFDECYGLASTQQRKNKDIPEGGSKGVVLLNLHHQGKAQMAFRKYVDCLLDLLLPSEHVVDHYGKEEILFLGPDEGTADLMDWAAQHARSRGYRFWKAFTTGKSTALGGIPHDVYGMTTNSVRAYVEGIQRKLELDGSACTKAQTGGPDGDLGSNEILLGHERTVCVIDGGGVAFDPAGLDVEQLKSLARRRVNVAQYDAAAAPLSSGGFVVRVDDQMVTLPDGSVVEKGVDLRNKFHLNPLLTADFFVPCGGRPAAVSSGNVERFMFTPDGSLRFKYVVEGANLFFTADARLQLEENGVVLFKDASANKGGVTSSSLEVLAALVMTDAEFGEHMTRVEGQDPPPFYQRYVAEVQTIIRRNAEAEFEAIWREHESSGEPRTVLTDKLSAKINNLTDSVRESALFDKEALRAAILRSAIPPVLLETLTLPTIEARLPEVYKRSLFASALASRFVYEHGLSTPEFAFFMFVDGMLGDH